MKLRFCLIFYTQEFWRSGPLSHTSCTCKTTGAPGSKASSSSSPSPCSSQFWLWLPSSPFLLSPSHRSNVILSYHLSLFFDEKCILEIINQIQMLIIDQLVYVFACMIDFSYSSHHSSYWPKKPLSLLCVELPDSQVGFPLGFILL